MCWYKKTAPKAAISTRVRKFKRRPSAHSFNLLASTHRVMHCPSRCHCFPFPRVPGTSVAAKRSCVCAAGSVDTDRDGVCDTCDSCPRDYSAVRRDSDGDGIGDVCDNCVSVFNPSQVRVVARSCGLGSFQLVIPRVFLWCSLRWLPRPWAPAPCLR